MGYNARLNPQLAVTNYGSVATDGSALNILFNATQAGQVLGARMANCAGTIASGTTAGSAVNVYVMKNASDTSASVLASSRLGTLAALGTAEFTLATSTALQRFSAGDVYCAAIVGGAILDADISGAVVQISYMYAWSFPNTATP